MPRKKAVKNKPGSGIAASRISASTFPALREFLRGYLHQDWQDEHATPAEAAEQFCKDASGEQRMAVASEWEAFRQQTKNLSLPAISALLASPLGASWSPNSPGQLDAISAVFRRFDRKI